MIVAIHQPSYFPWFGLIEKIALCDTFVILDDVQFNARAFQHRTLYSEESGSKYLTLSVNSQGHQQTGLKIKDVLLTNQSQTVTHFERLKQRYSRRPGWILLKEKLSEILNQKHERLIDLTLSTLKLTLESFGIQTPLLLSSDLRATGQKDTLMLALTLAAGGKTYLSGIGAKDYMREEIFSNSGIQLIWQNFEHPEFSQSHKGAFQKGCFALEWVLEDPESAPRKFSEQIFATKLKMGMTNA